MPTIIPADHIGCPYCHGTGRVPIEVNILGLVRLDFRDCQYLGYGGVDQKEDVEARGGSRKKYG